MDNNEPGESRTHLCAEGIQNLQLLVWPTVQKDHLAGMMDSMGDYPVPNLQDEVANIHNAASVTMEK